MPTLIDNLSVTSRRDRVSLEQVTLVLTNAQILALPQVSIQVVPAQGPTKVILPVAAVAILDATAGAYTVDPQAAWTLNFDASTCASGLVPIGSQGMNLQNVRYLLQFPIVPTKAAAEDLLGENVLGAGVYAGSSVVVEGLRDTALTFGDVFWGVAAYTGGHVDNSLRLTVAYRVFDIETGWFA